jgi:predicted transcriptional regulator of viral defense system
MGPRDICDETGINAATVRSTLSRMRREGTVKKVKRGKYVV